MFDYYSTLLPSKCLIIEDRIVFYKSAIDWNITFHSKNVVKLIIFKVISENTAVVGAPNVKPSF
jgi:hypothetical protein